MKSTTGAYGDYPDYYYSKGNLFGSYLRGRRVSRSWDTRKELEALEGGHAVIRPRESAALALRTWRTDLGRYVHGHFSDEFAFLILHALSGEPEPLPRSADVYRTLDDFAATVLSEEERGTVQSRLQTLVEEARRKARSAQAAKASASKAKKRVANAAVRPRPKPGGAAQARSVSLKPVPDLACNICGVALTDEQRAACGRKPSIFYGRGYCVEHAAKVEGFAK